MLDLPRMKSIRLTGRPKFQRVIGHVFLGPQYGLLPGVEIAFEHADRVPSEPVIYAMNHTDRYNYWPFQYQLWRQLDRFTATWVKGKYYQNELLAKFMEMTNNIPTVSRGYVISRDFLSTIGRPPTDDEYAALREAVVTHDAEGLAERVPAELLSRPRDVLGRRFDPDAESLPDCIDQVFREMMRCFVALNADAFDSGLDVLVFPQGTRSIRLSRGHVGLAQIALKYRKTVVPVGCNGSDHVYPGGSPFAKKGRIVYRFGSPLRYEDMERFHVDADYEPFTEEAERAHRAQFQGYVDEVMARIDELLDESYRFSDDQGSEGVQGTSRFV